MDRFFAGAVAGVKTRRAFERGAERLAQGASSVVAAGRRTVAFPTIVALGAARKARSAAGSAVSYSHGFVRGFAATHIAAE